ncbi:MAG: methyltransferase domain-containing protein [Clostridia bacterium]|nr:methyltransferase domain-containing protein [Clostridia bacterium]
MNNKKIGQYIQFLRKQKGLSQKELAERICVSFQAVSKWETGDNLPDASILLDLADILDTTTDKILSGGSTVLRKNKRVNIEGLKEGITALEDLETFFGRTSAFYIGAVSGINDRLQINIENYLYDEDGRQMLLAEALIECLMNGYYVEEADVDANFHSESIRRKIKKHLNDCALFAGKAQNYLDYRPTYPQPAIDLIFSLTKSPVLADIGSGTGKLSQLLVRRVNTLYAIEPNMQMRQTAEHLLSHNQNYVSIAASAEHTTLSDASVDIITVAEAYHWFDNEEAKAEFRRILKSNGYVVLLWNRFGGDRYDAEKEAINAKYRQPSASTYEERAISLFGVGNYQSAEFDNSMLQTYEEFLGGWSSASYIPREGTDGYVDFTKKVADLFHRHAKNGLIETTVQTVCFYGKLNI